MEWLILFILLSILLCLLEIRKLKKSIPQEVRRQILPHLSLEISEKEMGLFLKNEGYLPAQGIKIEDTEVLLEDTGFKVNYILKFPLIKQIDPKTRVALKFDVYDKEGRFLPEPTERLFVHLLKPTFKVKISFSNLEGNRFCVLFSKKGEKFILGETKEI